MSFYQRRPTLVEAIQWTGHNEAEIKEFCPIAIFSHMCYASDPAQYETDVIVPTLIGNHFAHYGDFIVKDPEGEFFPCEEEAFHQLYEEVKQDG